MVALLSIQIASAPAITVSLDFTIGMKTIPWKVVFGIAGALVALFCATHYRTWRVEAQIGSQMSVLEHSDKFVLYSLEESIDVEGSGSKLGHFRYIGIRGKAVVTDPKLRAQLTRTLFDGMVGADHDYSCFSPGVGIRAIQGKRTVDTLICFGCGHVRFYENGQETRLLISNAGEKVFNDALIKKKLPHF